MYDVEMGGSPIMLSTQLISWTTAFALGSRPERLTIGELPPVLTGAQASADASPRAKVADVVLTVACAMLASNSIETTPDKRAAHRVRARV
jgi:hypothetical protein